MKDEVDANPEPAPETRPPTRESAKQEIRRNPEGAFRAARETAENPRTQLPAFAVGADSGDSGIMAEPAASLPDTETLPGRVKRSLIGRVKPFLIGRVKRSLLARAKPFLIGRVLYPKISINIDKFTGFFDKLSRGNAGNCGARMRADAHAKTGSGGRVPPRNPGAVEFCHGQLVTRRRKMRGFAGSCGGDGR